MGKREFFLVVITIFCKQATTVAEDVSNPQFLGSVCRMRYSFHFFILVLFTSNDLHIYIKTYRKTFLLQCVKKKVELQQFSCIVYVTSNKLFFNLILKSNSELSHFTISVYKVRNPQRPCN